VEQRQRSILKLCCLAVVVLFSWATGQDLRIGVLAHDVAPLFGATKVEKGVDVNAEIVFGEKTVRAFTGFSLASHGHSHSVYGGVLVGTVGTGSFAEFGSGFAYIVNPLRNFGSDLLFRFSLEIGHKWGRRMLSFYFAHMSNGKAIFGWDVPNAGLDVLGVRLGIQF